MNKRDYFSELGVQPLINAAGTFTNLTASLMLPEMSLVLGQKLEYLQTNCILEDQLDLSSL